MPNSVNEDMKLFGPFLVIQRSRQRDDDGEDVCASPGRKEQKELEEIRGRWEDSEMEPGEHGELPSSARNSTLPSPPPRGSPCSPHRICQAGAPSAKAPAPRGELTLEMVANLNPGCQ